MLNATKLADLRVETEYEQVNNHENTQNVLKRLKSSIITRLLISMHLYVVKNKAQNKKNKKIKTFLKKYIDK